MRGVVPYLITEINYARLVFQFVPKLQEHEGKAYEPFEHIGNGLQETDEALPMFLSGLVLYCQDISPDFYTVVFPVFMSRVSHDEPLVKMIISNQKSLAS